MTALAVASDLDKRIATAFGPDVTLRPKFGGGRPGCFSLRLLARALQGFVRNSVQTPRITSELRVPAFESDADNPYS
jgi:hypothetical protein